MIRYYIVYNFIDISNGVLLTSINDIVLYNISNSTIVNSIIINTSTIIL